MEDNVIMSEFILKLLDSFEVPNQTINNCRITANRITWIKKRPANQHDLLVLIVHVEARIDLAASQLRSNPQLDSFMETEMYAWFYL